MSLDRDTVQATPGGVVPVRLAEVLAALSLATDLGLGQPMDYLLRTCLLATHLAAALGASAVDAANVYYVALLRWIGCTSHAHELARIFPDEIAARARYALLDAAQPGGVFLDAVRHAGEGKPPAARLATLAGALAVGPTAGPQQQFRASCEVAQMLASRLRFGPDVVRSLAYGFERWDGRGFPTGVLSEAIPLPVRIVQVAQDAEAFHRHAGVQAAIDVVRQRAGRAYDPHVAQGFCRDAAALLAALEEGDVWARVVEAEPAPRQMLSGDAGGEVLEMLADFVDLKSPYTTGHSRGVAQLAASAARALGLPDEAATSIRRAGLLHDLGRTGVPNGIWDKPGPLSAGEWERVRLHPYYTERILARAPSLSAYVSGAAHHERLDGSGYHRGVRSGALDEPARILAAADAYHAMLEPRPHRSPLTPEVAAAQLRAEASGGRQHANAVEAVLSAAGHRARRRGTWPAGLSNREVEVLRHVARGLSTREVARRLVISERTAAHHIQHVYAKIGVSTRGAAALFAMQNDLVQSDV